MYSVVLRSKKNCGMIRSINVKVSFLECTYQDLPGTALSYNVCLSLKNSKRGRGSTVQLTTTSRSARQISVQNVWLTCVVSNPSPLLSMVHATITLPWASKNHSRQLDIVLLGYKLVHLDLWLVHLLQDYTFHKAL